MLRIPVPDGYNQIATYPIAVTIDPILLLVGGLLAFLTFTSPWQAEAANSWFEEQYLTGDWGGLRTQLNDHGISPYFLTALVRLILGEAHHI